LPKLINQSRLPKARITLVHARRALRFVQNALLNLPGMSDGSVTVVDLQKQEVVKSMDTLKMRGSPELYRPAAGLVQRRWPLKDPQGARAAALGEN